MMSRLAKVALCVLFVTVPRLAFAQDTTVTQTPAPPVATCPQQVITIALADVDCKAGLCSNPNEPTLSALFGGAGYVQNMGQGLGTMLITALRYTNCFHIIDLAQVKRIREQMQATGQQVQPPHIDRLINLSITSIELSGQRGGGVIVPVPYIGAVAVSKQEAKLGIDVSVMNPSTLEIEQVQGFQADSQKTSVGVAGAFFSPGFAAGAGWSWSKNVNLDAVARYVVVQAANYLAQTLANAGPPPVVPPAPAAVTGQPGAPPAQAVVTSNTEQVGGQVRVTVHIIVPAGATQQPVKVVAVGSDGHVTTVYEGVHGPGDTVSATAAGPPPLIVQIYVGGSMVKQITTQ